MSKILLTGNIETLRENLDEVGYVLALLETLSAVNVEDLQAKDSITHSLHRISKLLGRSFAQLSTMERTAQEVGNE